MEIIEISSDDENKSMVNSPQKVDKTTQNSLNFTKSQISKTQSSIDFAEDSTLKSTLKDTQFSVDFNELDRSQNESQDLAEPSQMKLTNKSIQPTSSIDFGVPSEKSSTDSEMEEKKNSDEEIGNEQSPKRKKLSYKISSDSELISGDDVDLLEEEDKPPPKKKQRVIDDDSEEVELEIESQLSQPTQNKGGYALRNTPDRRKAVYSESSSDDDEPPNDLNTQDLNPEEELKRKIEIRKKRLRRLAKKHSKKTSPVRKRLTFNKPHSSSDEENTLDILKRRDEQRKRKRNRKKTKREFIWGGREDDRNENSESDDSLNDFIVDDDEPIIEEPWTQYDSGQKTTQSLSLPQKFCPTFKPKESFSVYVQYITSCILDDDFDRSIKEDEKDKYFASVISSVEEPLIFRKNAMVSSAAWKSDFKESIEKYATFQSIKMRPGLDCEACGRTNHPATFIIKLKPPIYDARSLWEKSCTIKEIEGEKKKFYVGRQCKKRSELYHIFHHYKFNLIKKIKKKLEKLKRQTTDHVKLVNLILQDESYINKLYHNYKKLLDTAEKYSITPNENDIPDLHEFIFNSSQSDDEIVEEDKSSFEKKPFDKNSLFVNEDDYDDIVDSEEEIVKKKDDKPKEVIVLSDDEIDDSILTETLL